MNIITVESRNMLKKAKQLRKAGIVPCTIYGGSLPESLLIQMDQNAAKRMLRSKQEGSKMEIELDGKVMTVQIKDIESDIIKNEIIHICFQALEADKRVNSKAQIILENTDKVVGILEQMLFEVPYSALPADMIDTVTVDLEGLAAGSFLTLEDISDFKNENINLQVSSDSMILKISDRKGVVLEVAE